MATPPVYVSLHVRMAGEQQYVNLMTIGDSIFIRIPGSETVTDTYAVITIPSVCKIHTRKLVSNKDVNEHIIPKILELTKYLQTEIYYGEKDEAHRLVLESITSSHTVAGIILYSVYRGLIYPKNEIMILYMSDATVERGFILKDPIGFINKLYELLFHTSATKLVYESLLLSKQI